MNDAALTQIVSQPRSNGALSVRDVVEEFAGALACGAVDRLELLLDDDVIVRTPGRSAVAGDHRGRPSAMASLTAAPVDDVQLGGTRVTEILVDGGRGLVVVEMAGRRGADRVLLRSRVPRRGRSRTHRRCDRVQRRSVSGRPTPRRGRRWSGRRRRGPLGAAPSGAAMTPHRCRLGVLAAILLASPLAVPSGGAGATTRDAERPDRCDERPVTAAFLDETFDEGVDGLVGADYQRAVELDDGRVLWLFQDAFVESPSGGVTFGHNAGLVQDGTCFDLLAGEGGRAWIELPGDAPFDRWLWPLDGYQLDDQTVRIHVAEMEERGGEYLGNTTPVATWVVDLDLATMELGDPVPAPDATDALYGFGITEDDEYRYLYAQCHRQFGFSWLGHDACAADVFVARQPLGRADAALEYWDGVSWSADASAAANIAPPRGPDASSHRAEPMQVERHGDRWIAVTKVDDWYGTTIRLDVADRPEGPWTTTAELPVATIDDDVSAYFASIVPSDDDGVTIAMSNNRWDGAFSESYRPVVATLPTWLWLSPSLS